MEKQASKFYQLRITSPLRVALEQLANRSLRSLADEIRRRISDSNSTASPDLIVDHPEFFNGAKEVINMRLVPELHHELKQLSEQNSTSINAEITKRLLLSDPLGDLNTTPYKSIERIDSEKGRVDEQQKNDYKGLCPQNEREKKMLEMYRQLTPDQQAQLNAIGDTFNQPIKHKKSG